MFEVVYRDILKQWTSCWQEALMAGFVFMVGNRQIDRLSNRHNGVDSLFFADGVFLYFLLYVTLFSRSIGSRQEVAFLPFSGDEVAGGNYYYLIEFPAVHSVWFSVGRNIVYIWKNVQYKENCMVSVSDKRVDRDVTVCFLLRKNGDG